MNLKSLLTRIATFVSLLAFCGPTSWATNPAITLTLNTASPGYPIPINFLGLSYETASLISTSPGYQLDTSGSSQGVITQHLMENLAPGVLRFGGNSVDKFDYPYWTRVARNGSTPTTELTSTDVNAAMSLANAVLWSVLWSVDLETATAASDADQINYIYGLANNPTQAVCIGNEPNLYPSTSLYYGSAGYTDSSTGWPTFRTAVLNSTPNAEIAGWDGTQGAETTTGWDAAVTSAIGGNIAVLNNHYYALMNQTQSIDELLSPGLYSDNHTFATGLATLAANSGIGEFRLSETDGGQAATSPSVDNTFAAALWNADYAFQMASINAFTSSAPHCAGVNFHCGAGGGFSSSPIQESDSVVTAEPDYYGLLLFRQAGVGQLVPVTMSNPGGVNLTAYGTLDAYGNLRVTAINKDTNSGNTATVNITPGSGYTSAQVMRLAAGSDENATTGITLGNNAVNSTTGDWSPTASENGPVTGGIYSTTVDYLSAALVVFPSIAKVQSGALISAGTGSISVTLPADSVAGHLLVATLVTEGGDSFTAPSGWIQAAALSTSNADTEVWYCFDCPRDVTSVTFGHGGTFAKGQLTEWSGFAASASLDVTGSASATSANSVAVSTTGATAHPVDLAITVFAEGLTSSGTASLAPGTGWTNLANNDSSSAYVHVAFDCQIGAYGTVAETETSNVSGGWDGLVVTFHQ